MKKILITLLLLISFILPTFAENKNKAENDCVNIAFTIDKNYYLFTMLTIQSIMRSKNPETNYKFYILEDNLTDRHKEKMTKFAKDNNADMVFYHVTTDSFDEGRNIYNYIKRITPIGMARILLPSVMPNEIKKVLYLDADILVTTDLKELYDTDLGKYYVGMVRNSSTQDSAIYKFGKEYYNSGVILMDLEKLRKNKIEEKMIAYLKENWQNFEYSDKKIPGLNTKFMYPDQDLINLILRGKIKTLNPKWNMQETNKNIITNEYKGIIHFIGSGKPWLLRNVTLPAYKLYLKNWSDSPFIMYMPLFWYTSKCKDKVTVYKDIIKLYKNEY